MPPSSKMSDLYDFIGGKHEMTASSKPAEKCSEPAAICAANPKKRKTSLEAAQARFENHLNVVEIDQQDSKQTTTKTTKQSGTKETSMNQTKQTSTSEKN